MAIRAKHLLIIVALGTWFGFGGYATRYIAGGLYLLSHKSDPTVVEADTWGEYWRDYKNDPKQKKKLQGSIAVPILFLFGVPTAIFLSTLNKRRSLHGDAKWATHAEVQRAGLLADSGIILGKLGGRYLMTPADKFTLLIAPTRSGKGVGTVIPNLLNWSQSVVAVDIKGTLFSVTSGFRERHGQAVFKFAPFDENFQTHRFNPLSYVRREPLFVVGDLQSIGYMLYPHGDGHTSSFFNDSARNYFVAVALYCIESDLVLTMGEVLRRSAVPPSGTTGTTGVVFCTPEDFLSTQAVAAVTTSPKSDDDTNDSAGTSIKTHWQSVLKRGASLSGKPLSSDCVNAMQRFLTGSDNTLANVLASFAAPLGIFANAVIDAATSADDFDVRDVRRKLMSIYVVIPPNRLDEASLLTNLFFSMVIDQNTKALPADDATLKHEALLVLDEFPALGRVQKFVKAVGYIAEYGIRVLTIAQSVSQMKARDLYGDEGARTLVANHMLRIMYAPREVQESQEYSELLGYTTEQGISRGRSLSRGSSTNSENSSPQKRALMMPQELRDMSPDRVIVQADNCKPVFADKICYYTDPVFMARLFSPASVPTLDIDAFLKHRAVSQLASPPDAAAPVSNINNIFPTMPPVTSKSVPIPAEVARMANYLFSNVQWNASTEDGETERMDLADANPA
jgi:type IV secretion system protein VirD4